MKIIMDGFGGDHAPKAVLEGAAAAVKEYGVDILITGKETGAGTDGKRREY